MRFYPFDSVLQSKFVCNTIERIQIGSRHFPDVYKQPWFITISPWYYLIVIVNALIVQIIVCWVSYLKTCSSVWTMWFFESLIPKTTGREGLKTALKSSVREWTLQVELSSQNMIHCHVRNLVKISQFNYDCEANIMFLHQSGSTWLMYFHVCIYFCESWFAHSVGVPSVTALLLIWGYYGHNLLTA